MIEEVIVQLLGDLVDGQVHPDIAPENSNLPYITYQQIGGLGTNFIDPTIPSVKNYRFQINVWSETRKEASQLAAQIEDVLRVKPELQTSVLGQPVAMHDVESDARGSRQDFSFWY